MAPVIPKTKYIQKYKKEWETEACFKDWLRPSPGSNAKAFCAYCKAEIGAHRKGLDEHAATKKHIRYAGEKKALAANSVLDKFVKPQIEEGRKRAELKIAAFIAEHCSILAVDHLCEVITNLDINSQVLKNVKLHRTKCTGLIMNVVSPCLLKDLIKDIGDSHFSLIVDETTAIDTTKVMCLMVRYFSRTLRKVCTSFYRLIQLENGTAEHMTKCLKDQLKADKLELENMIGIGIDGANAMAGKNNSVSSRLTEQIPHLVTIKCLSHSLHLCAEHACDVLPKSLDFMVKESHKWFSNSTSRNIEFQRLHKIVAGCDPKKIAKLSGTRWLARLNAIQTILDEWDSLKLHFEMSRTSERGDSGYKADTLFQMYNVENKLYLIFLQYSLKEIISVNKLFQSDSVEPLKLLKSLNDLLYSYLQKIVVPQQLIKANAQDLCDYPFKNFMMPVDCINFGYNFNELSSSCIQEHLIYIKSRCRDFLVKLTEELQARVPKNTKCLQQLCLFAPKVASSQFKEDITELAESFKGLGIDIDDTVTEYNLLHRVEAKSTSSDEYWATIDEETDAGGKKIYKNVTKLAMSLLCLPFSNASVERAFSVFNIVKDKLRNRIATKTADALLRIRLTLENKCNKFEPTTQMFKLFNSEEVYKSEFSDDVLEVLA